MSINECSTLPVLNKILAGHWLLQSAADLYENWRLVNRFAAPDCAGLVALSSVTGGVISMNTNAVIGGCQLATGQLECLIRYSPSVPYCQTDLNVVPPRSTVAQVAERGIVNSVYSASETTQTLPGEYCQGIYFQTQPNTLVSVCGIPSTHNVGTMTIKPDNVSPSSSGGASHQFGFSCSGPLYRMSAACDTWAGWQRVALCDAPQMVIFQKVIGPSFTYDGAGRLYTDLSYDASTASSIHLTCSGSVWMQGVDYTLCSNDTNNVCSYVRLLKNSGTVPASSQLLVETRMYRNTQIPGYGGFDIVSTTCDLTSAMSGGAIWNLPGTMSYDATVPGSIFISINGAVLSRGNDYTLGLANDVATGKCTTIVFSKPVASGSRIVVETRNGVNGLGQAGGPGMVYASPAECSGNPSFRKLQPSDLPVSSLAAINKIPIGCSGGPIDLSWIPAFVSLKENPGYVKIPGGMVFQWGHTSICQTCATFPFPTVFPNCCLWVVSQIQYKDNGAAAGHYNTVVSQTTSTFTLAASPGTLLWDDGATYAYGRWFAIGY